MLQASIVHHSLPCLSLTIDRESVMLMLMHCQQCPDKKSQKHYIPTHSGPPLCSKTRTVEIDLRGSQQRLVSQKRILLQLKMESFCSSLTG